MCKRNIGRLPLVCAPTEDQTRNLGKHPGRESNLRPFTLQNDTQLTEPRGQGTMELLICIASPQACPPLVFWS